MNIYLFIIVPAMAIMCIVFVCIIAGDIRAILRSIVGTNNYESIKHRTGRSYGQAAILVGGACLFLGEPKVCEELCDDLWHRGVQAEVQQLSVEDTQFDVL